MASLKPVFYTSFLDCWSYGDGYWRTEPKKKKQRLCKPFLISFIFAIAFTFIFPPPRFMSHEPKTIPYLFPPFSSLKKPISKIQIHIFAHSFSHTRKVVWGIFSGFFIFEIIFSFTFKPSDMKHSKPTLPLLPLSAINLYQHKTSETANRKQVIAICQLQIANW